MRAADHRPGDQNSSAAQLAHAIRERQLCTLFQPIVLTDSNQTYAFEALTRGPAGSWLHAPQRLFAVARREDAEMVLDLACAEQAMRRFVASGRTERLFINVSGGSVESAVKFSQRLIALLDSAGMPRERCTLELPIDVIDDHDSVGGNLAVFREAQLAIAISDIGSRPDPLKWSSARPAIIKLDPYISSRIDRDAIQQATVRTLVRAAQANEALLIATGVETAAQASMLRELGVALLQGLHVGHPDDEPRAVAVAPITATSPNTKTAITLCERVAAIPPNTRVQIVADAFRSDPQRLSVAVVDAGRVVGVVFRDRLFATLSLPLHAEIYHRRTVATVMEQPRVLVDAQLTLEQVSQLVTVAGTRLDEEFVIVRDGRYLGLGKTMTLLREITAQQVSAAQWSNPLTLLPGNPLVQAHLERLLAAEEPFVACYFDLDFFKPFNDHYGYARGDRVIRQLADCLRHAFEGAHSLIAHIGGDDFMVITQTSDWVARTRRVLQRFASVVSSFYDSADIAAGYIHARGRDGCDACFGFLTVSVAALPSTVAGTRNVETFSEKLAALKREAKRHSGERALISTHEGTVPLPQTLASEPIQVNSSRGL